MNRICRASGCGAEASSRFSVYCAIHKARLRRHGAVDQGGVTKASLEPYLKLVQARIDKNLESPAWGRLEERWVALVDHARSILVDYQRGRAGARHEHVAAQQVAKLAEIIRPRDVVETALALFVMQEREPRHFRTDVAFRTQLVRRVRGLGGVNAGVYYDHTSGRTKRVYKELPPRASALMGHWLVEAFGAAGIYLARLEQADHEKKNKERQELHKALSELV